MRFFLFRDGARFPWFPQLILPSTVQRTSRASCSRWASSTSCCRSRIRPRSRCVDFPGFLDGSDQLITRLRRLLTGPGQLGGGDREPQLKGCVPFQYVFFGTRGFVLDSTHEADFALDCASLPVPHFSHCSLPSRPVHSLSAPPRSENAAPPQPTTRPLSLPLGTRLPAACTPTSSASSAAKTRPFSTLPSGPSSSASRRGIPNSTTRSGPPRT